MSLMLEEHFKMWSPLSLGTGAGLEYRTPLSGSRSDKAALMIRTKYIVSGRVAEASPGSSIFPRVHAGFLTSQGSE